MTVRVRIPKIVPAASDWASTFGVDRWGLFSGIRVGNAEQLLRWIEPGTFMMGAPSDELGTWSGEQPQHAVTIPQGFWLAETPVTQQFYQAVTGENPSRFSRNPDHPVERVSWDDATEFCQKLTTLLSKFDDTRVRLPTEAEWEYACRAGTTTPLYDGTALTSETGECPNLHELAWYNQNSGNRTHPVREKQPNDWGLYDMLGNVWEWCEDVGHGSYHEAPTDGSAWVDDAKPSGGRVIRGGGWALDARGCRCAFRFRWPPDFRFEDGGFRFVFAARFNEDIRRFP